MLKKGKKSERKVFMKDPFKKLFTAKTSGKLCVSKDVLETYLDGTYSDKNRNEELPYIPGLVRPTEPGAQFDIGPFRITELDDFLKKA